LNRDGLLLAYHDRSDGGLFVAACEMAFASRRGVSLDLDGICYDAQACDVDGSEKRPTCWPAAISKTSCVALFNEELGALIQIRRADREKVTPILRALRRALSLCRHDERVGRNPRHPQRQARAARKACRPAACLVRNQLPDAGLRDNPSCANRNSTASSTSPIPA
jgi:phosphoribosylformylglycinamidine synthase